jgi:hypothetical protein
MYIQHLYHTHPPTPFPHILHPPTGTNPPQAGPVLPSCSPIS